MVGGRRHPHALIGLVVGVTISGCKPEHSAGEGTGTATEPEPPPTEVSAPRTATYAAGCPAASGVATMAAAELRRLAREQPCALGSVSLGRPEKGALVNPVHLPAGPHWVVAYPDNAWATSETILALRRALATAYQGQPDDTPKTYIGDLSAPWGGPLPPHKSHQSGRDVDVSYPRVAGDDRWWHNASATTLDAGRTWTLLRAFVTVTDLEVIFIDRSLQRLILHQARRSGEDPGWLDRLFDLGRDRPAIIRHAPEHTNHMHVRFRNPVAQRTGRLVHDLLARGIDPEPTAAQREDRGEANPTSP